MKQQSHFVKNCKSLHKCWAKLNQTRCLNKKIQLQMISFLILFFSFGWRTRDGERKRDRHGHVWLAWRPGGDWNSSDRPRGLLVFRVCTTSLLRWGRSSSSSLEKKNWNAEWRIWSNVTVDFPATVRIFFFFFFFFPPVTHFFSYLSEKTLIFFIFFYFFKLAFSNLLCSINANFFALLNVSDWLFALCSLNYNNFQEEEEEKYSFAIQFGVEWKEPEGIIGPIL
jgi:hypothetical protein